MKRILVIGVCVLIVVTVAWTLARRSRDRSQPPVGVVTVPQAGVFRLSGTVEATRARTVFVPRLAGQTAQTLVITHLIRAGSRVAAGDPIVEFDPQEQVRAAADRRAALVDLDGQIQKKRSEHAIAQSKDQTAVTEAERNVSRARLDMLKNDLVSKVEAEKNSLALEQATARLEQLRETSPLKRQAEVADIRILEIQRARAERAVSYAEGNSRIMAVTAPFPGLVVLKQIWKGNTMGEVAEGEEVRPGLPIVDIVDASAMQVRAFVNQADVGLIASGESATIRLDAYPELVFPGRVELIAPLGVASSLTPKVRTFVALVSIQGSSPQLMPDLTASVEVAGVSRPAGASIGGR